VSTFNLSRLRAVLFDLDGTLIDSYDAITASVNHLRAHQGLAPLKVSEVRKHVGHGPGHLLAHTVGVGDPKENAALYRAHHPGVMKQGTRLLPGALPTLAALKIRNLKLGLCSNKPIEYTRELLAYLGIASCFDAVLGPEDVAQPKPAPDMLLAALSRLAIFPDEALYIGDMTVDIETARAAGVHVWIVPTGSDDIDTLQDARPDRLLKDLSELMCALND
jgi:phosphoglycolate phosphatase